MLCAKCKEDFPTEILFQITGNDEFIMPVCGICALEIINATHGINLDRFQGEMAEKPPSCLFNQKFKNEFEASKENRKGLI